MPGAKGESLKIPEKNCFISMPIVLSLVGGLSKFILYRFPTKNGPEKKSGKKGYEYKVMTYLWWMTCEWDQKKKI